MKKQKKYNIEFQKNKKLIKYHENENIEKIKIMKMEKKRN